MTLARTVSVFSALAVMIALTRILDPDAYGAYKKLWLVFFLFSPGITSMLVRTLYYRGEVGESPNALWTCVTISGAASALISVVMVFGGGVIASVLQAPELELPLRWFALYVFFATYSSIAEPIFVLAHRKKWLVGYNLTYNAIEACLIVIPFYLEMPLEVVIRFMTIGPLLRALFVTAFTLQQAGLPVIREVRRELSPFLSYALGILMIFFTGIGITQIDKLIVALFFESDELYAVYVVGAQQLPVVPAFISSVSATLVAQYASRLTETDRTPALRAFRAATDRLFLIITPVIVACFVMAEPIMVFLFEQYAASAPVFKIYVLTILSRLILSETMLLALGRSRFLAGMNVAELILNIPLSIALLQFFGILGPALATLIAHLTAITVVTLYTRTTENINLKYFLPSRRIRPLMVTLPGLLAISYVLLQTGWPDFVMLVICGVAATAVIVFHNRKFVTPIQPSGAD